MIFGGFQKLTLLDFPGQVACTLFTKGCNFYCPFCHNAPLVNKLEEASSYPEEEILAFLKKRQGVLEGVCITGGEPLIHPDLPDFIKKVKSLGYKVKLDTNGSFPEKLKELVSCQLVDYVAMDIKNSFPKYPLTAGNFNVDISKIEESIDFLLEGNVPYEFRTTVCDNLHTIEDIEAICQRIKGADKYFIQNFLNSGNIIGKDLSPLPEETIRAMCAISQKYTKYSNYR